MKAGLALLPGTFHGSEDGPHARSWWTMWRMVLGEGASLSSPASMAPRRALPAVLECGWPLSWQLTGG